MPPRRVACVLTIAAIQASSACSSSTPAPTPTPTAPAAVANAAAIEIVGLRATVEPLETTSPAGLLYRLTYGVRESTGRAGATLVTQHFTLSDGRTADGQFNTMPPPHVPPATTITVQSTLSIYPASTPATRVTFSIDYADDGGRSGTASADADVERRTP